MTTTAWFAPLRHLSPESFERYLEMQAVQGKHLEVYDRWSAVRLRFTAGEPATVRYVAERRIHPAPNDYYAFRQDLGWEHTGRFGDRHLWRKEYTGGRPQRFVGGRHSPVRVPA
ncbi:MAG: DUF2812 domain-containing protein [Gordonia sp. (in: high G+C Gram-positive bacteria)]|uniref:DUF2812 domain-containing protein n=1 Tax=Gordonia sp. (in: high G+C Gram-positive bacteria) TaxID=84139 RepID=UPI003BB66F67